MKQTGLGGDQFDYVDSVRPFAIMAQFPNDCLPANQNCATRVPSCRTDPVTQSGVSVDVRTLEKYIDSASGSRRSSSSSSSLACPVIWGCC